MKKRSFSPALKNGQATTVCTNGSEEHKDSAASNDIKYQPVGYIETSFQNKKAVPRQASILANAKGTVVIDSNVFNNPEHALSGLEEFSHMWIIFHFHATESNNVSAKVSPPRLDGERRGIFSTRSPHRACPIGLSLVKILNVEGNKIQFLGVDMVNGTPVLDIKPYIPQYDYPISVYGETMVRPSTEGLSEDLDVSNLRLSPRLTCPVGIDTSSPHSRSPIEGTPSPESGTRLMTPDSPSTPSHTSPSIDILEDNGTRSPVHRPDTERGAPDGQERFTPPQSAQLVNIARDGIRVAPWVLNPPSQTYEVHFTENSLTRLNELIGDRAQSFKQNIESLLAEDPRSTYVRNRYPDHEYSCVLEDLSITCVFDNNSSICTIVTVKSAEELQQS
ncbi:tRNA (adenine(37)-N6)-methyltransferase [Eumeta japonica]|uniref:tRNA (Adenine(37)-N6)-methyltransferase n=1 Tax=Eumeta variegata TaxID=151549 RepID=A0A4C1TSB7_EUMVA|nr:tRNA (adenine(37)-N6)-methyltransferase [Eumeta japonica]